MGSSKVYYVKPKNFGLELLMLKWPDDEIPHQDSLHSAKDYLNNLCDIDIEISIEGFQFHTDGCMLLRGYDKNSVFRNIRKIGMETIPNIPKRQSSWCHIPLGRILSSVDKESYAKLLKLSKESITNWSHTFKVSNIKILEETRWYQEENKLIFQKNLH